MTPSDGKNDEILIQLLGVNRKQAEWLKNLDFKVVYYCLGFFIAIIAWFSAHPPQTKQLPFLAGTVILLSVFSILFLLRNHTRHNLLNVEFRAILDALGLTKAGRFGSAPVCVPSPRQNSWAFHLGRGIYAMVIAGGAILTIALLSLVDTRTVESPADAQESTQTEVQLQETP